MHATPWPDASRANLCKFSTTLEDFGGGWASIRAFSLGTPGELRRVPPRWMAGLLWLLSRLSIQCWSWRYFHHSPVLRCFWGPTKEIHQTNSSPPYHENQLICCISLIVRSNGGMNSTVLGQAMVRIGTNTHIYRSCWIKMLKPGEVAW